MKTIQEQLAWLSKTLAGLSNQVNQISAQINRAAAAREGKLRAGRKPGKQTPAKAAGVRKNTVLDSVFNAIQSSRGGASIPQLKNKTKLGDRQLSNALYKLTKKGLVHAKSRGLYVKS
jgi:hypothetical protein